MDVPALMVTDTAPYRYRHYHQATDTSEQVDDKRLARITVAMPQVVDDLFASL